jgi:hypothetical protein
MLSSEDLIKREGARRRDENFCEGMLLSFFVFLRFAAVPKDATPFCCKGRKKKKKNLLQEKLVAQQATTD